MSARFLLPLLLSGLSLILPWGYLVLLAVLVRSVRSLPPKRAAFLIAISLPVRLGLLGLALVWSVRSQASIGVLSVVLGLWTGRFTIQHYVHTWGK